jgi:MFS family permease
MVVMGMVGTFGLNFQLTTALMARLVFDKGAGEYGLLGSIMAIGSLAGALIAARREHPRLRLVLGAAFAFGLFASVAALMPTYELFALSLIPVGLSSLTLMTAANASVQMSTEPAMRGRVMALYMAVFMGGTPIGSPVVGWVGEHFGARWTILLGGLVTIATAAAALAWLVLHKGVRVRYHHGLVVTPRPELDTGGSLNDRQGNGDLDARSDDQDGRSSAGRGISERSRARSGHGVGQGSAGR